MRRVVVLVSALVLVSCSSQPTNEVKPPAAPAVAQPAPLAKAPQKGPELDATTPILVGPAGAQFWTSVRAASVILGSRPIPAAMTPFTGRQWSTETGNGDRYVALEIGGLRQRPVLAAKAEGTIRKLPGGAHVMMYRTPIAGAPWIGHAEADGRYFKLDVGDKLTAIGLDSDGYRKVAGENVLMTHARAGGDPWTAYSRGKVYRLQGAQPVPIGEARWALIQPVAGEPGPAVPVLTSRLLVEGAPWVGEYGGAIFVEAPPTVL
jgi:hypothetical protein